MTNRELLAIDLGFPILASACNLLSALLVQGVAVAAMNVNTHSIASGRKRLPTFCGVPVKLDPALRDGRVEFRDFHGNIIETGEVT